ncbi:MAG: hypothetical protein WD424_08930 [Paenibacillaceae bacterium]
MCHNERNSDLVFEGSEKAIVFDPTIYDNLKVVLEGELYDRDLSEHIQIVDRSDLVDLAIMSRMFIMRFQIPNHPEFVAEIKLHAGAEDLAGEIVEVNNPTIGCRIQVGYRVRLTGDYIAAEEASHKIRKHLVKIWGEDMVIGQELCFFPNVLKDVPIYECRSTIEFGRKITEEQIGDIPRLVDHLIMSVQHQKL